MQRIRNNFEIDYKHLVDEVMTLGDLRSTRNGNVKSLFGKTLKFDIQEGFPILTGRKMFYKGVLGELAAMLRGPSTLKDFEIQGCNYWSKWATKEGKLELDYGNAWLDYNGVNQLQNVIDKLNNDPHDRRMIIDSWRPDRLEELSLPCCHYTYQFYVREGMYLDMVWTQRSADTMIGIPADAIFAAAWIIALGNEVKLIPGEVTMNFGDTHIYEEHVGGVTEYMKEKIYDLPMATFNKPMGTKLVDFISADLSLKDYKHGPKIEFELKA